MASEDQNPASGTDQPNKQSGSTPEQVAIALAKFESPPPDANCKNAGKEKKHCLDYVTFGLQVGGFVVLCVYAAYTIKMYCANRDAADAAKSAANTAKHSLKLAQLQFEAENRPYIYATPHERGMKLPPRIAIDIPRHGIVVNVAEENMGKSPATHIQTIWPEIIIATDAEAQVATIQIQSAQDKSEAPFSNNALFAGAPANIGSATNAGNIPAEIVGKINSGDTEMVVFGGWRYRSQYFSDKTYLTQYCWRYDPRAVGLWFRPCQTPGTVTVE